MSIERFEITDTDALDTVRCENPPQIMVVAGPNGVGKSTLFEELRNLTRNPSDERIELDRDLKPIYISPHRAPAEFDITDVTLLKSPNKRLTDSLGDPTYSGGSSSELPSEIRYDNERTRFDADYATYFEVQRRIAELTRDRNTVATTLVDRGETIDREDLPDIIGPIEDCVDYLLPGIELADIEATSGEYIIRFENRTGDLVEFNELSSGERDVLAMVIAMLEKQLSNEIARAKDEPLDEENLLMLIDSPEAYMHPSLQERFIRYCRKLIAESEENYIQLLMCTHSKAILDDANPEETYFLLYPDQVEDNQLQSAKNIDDDLMQEVFGQIGYTALSTGNPILLVEGPSDVEVLTHLHPTLDTDVDIIPMGGKQKVRDLNTAFNELLPQLQPMGVEVHALVDRDREWDLQGEVEDQVFVLPATNLENLLLKPQPLYEALLALEHPTLARKGIDSASDIETTINEIIQSDSFIQEEVRLRMIQEFSINLGLKGLDGLDADSFADRIDQVTEKTKERAEGKIDAIRDGVEDDIETGTWDNLNGKAILSQLAGEFGAEKDQLARTTADKIDPTTLDEDYLDFIADLEG